MEHEESACRCSNILILGHVLQPCYLPNIPGAERVRFSGCVSCLMVRRKAISVADRSLVTFKQQSEICTDITCQKCNTTFRLFLGRPCCFIGRVQEHPRPKSRKAATKIAVPKCVFDLIEFEPANDTNFSDSDDIDFDVMFGNRSMPLVGSYMSQFGLDAATQRCFM